MRGEALHFERNPHPPAWTQPGLVLHLGKHPLHLFTAQGFWVDFEAEGPAQVAMRFENDEERAKQLAEVTEICGNTRLSQHYLSLARDLDVMEAKLPEEVLADSSGLTEKALFEPGLRVNILNELSQHYLSLARDLNGVEAKLPEGLLTSSSGLTDAVLERALS